MLQSLNYVRVPFCVFARNLSITVEPMLDRESTAEPERWNQVHRKKEPPLSCYKNQQINEFIN